MLVVRHVEWFVWVQVGELNVDTGPELAKFALREFGRLPDVVADSRGCVSNEFLRWMREESGLGSSGLGNMRVVLDYKTESASEASPMKQDVLARRHRVGRMMLNDLPGRQPCLHALFPEELLGKDVANVLDVERVHASSCEIMTDNPILFLSHALSGNHWCPAFRIGRGEGAILKTFIKNMAEEKQKNPVQFSREAPVSLQESLEEFGTESAINNGIVPCKEAMDDIDKQKKGHVEFIEESPVSLQEPLQHMDNVTRLNNSVVPQKIVTKESNPEDEVLAVLDCRCQYEIIQRRVKRSIRWAFLGYVVVMSAIPSLLLGSSSKF